MVPDPSSLLPYNVVCSPCSLPRPTTLYYPHRDSSTTHRFIRPRPRALPLSIISRGPQAVLSCPPSFPQHLYPPHEPFKPR